MTGSSQRRRSSTTTDETKTTDPRQTQQEQSRDGERVWKVSGRPCFKRNARLTHLPWRLSCQGSTSSRAPCRSSRHSPRLRSSPSSSSLVVSRSQGRSQEASLAPRPTSCSPTLLVALALDHRSVKAYHTRVSTASKLLFFLVCVFLAVAVAGFSTVLQLIIRDTVQIACSGGISSPGRDPGKCPNRNFHLGSTRGDSSITSQRKRITNIARDGEGVRVPRSVALRRRRV